jgi:hypothetical protein
MLTCGGKYVFYFIILALKILSDFCILEVFILPSGGSAALVPITI